MVKILLRQEVNPDKPDIDGVVKTLFRQEEVSTDKADNGDKALLSYAAMDGEVVEVLLGWEEVNPDGSDKDGRTPLSLATRNAFTKVVTVLQSSNLVTPSTI